MQCRCPEHKLLSTPQASSITSLCGLATYSARQVAAHREASAAASARHATPPPPPPSVTAAALPLPPSACVAVLIDAGASVANHPYADAGLQSQSSDARSRREVELVAPSGPVPAQGLGVSDLLRAAVGRRHRAGPLLTSPYHLPPHLRCGSSRNEPHIR